MRHRAKVLMCKSVETRQSVSEHCLQQRMCSPPSTVEAARRRLRDLVRRGEKLGLTRGDLVSLPSARLLTSCGSRWRWRSTTSLAITALAVVLATTAVLTKCYVYRQATTSSYTSGVSAASLDPWWQQQQLQRLVSVFCLFPKHSSSYCSIILCFIFAVNLVECTASNLFLRGVWVNLLISAFDKERTYKQPFLNVAHTKYCKRKF